MLETRPRTRPDARTDARAGWLVPAGLLLVTVLVSALNANTFAVHAGSAGHETHVGAPSAQSRQAAAGEDAAHGTSGGDTHVLHVLGACLALLAAAVALATSSSFRVPWDRPRPVTERTGAVRARLQAWRGPPALSPPTTSAVLRN